MNRVIDNGPAAIRAAVVRAFGPRVRAQPADVIELHRLRQAAATPMPRETKTIRRIEAAARRVSR